jgi:alkylation response protein AidB-like acyl-CoA dehydrogenase
MGMLAEEQSMASYSSRYAPDATETTLQAAVALRPRIRAARDDIEQQRRLPPLLVRELKETGVFRMTMPRAWGGQ